MRSLALFRKRAARPALDQVKAWARAALARGDEVGVAVNEIVCADPGCPGTETVILLMVPGERTRAVKIQKELEAVTEQDVRAALVG
jgi:hypothetical protein